MRAAARTAGLAAAVLSAAAVTAAPALAAPGLAVSGSDRVFLALPAGAPIAPYENLGYRLSTTGDGWATVEVEVTPLLSSAPLPAPSDRPPAGRVQVLARSLTAGSATVYEAVSRILGWIAGNVAYELDRSQPQDPEAVLERRSAYCTGFARLAVTLLQEVEIEAREVPGYVASSGPGEGPGRYHRWIEVHYPDRGWAFSDPLTSHHFVPATYLPLAAEQVLPPVERSVAGGGALLERLDRLEVVDVSPTAPPGVRVRRNQPRQQAAALRVVVGGEAPGVAVLEGQGRRHTRALQGGAGTFVGLAPGRYTLSLLVDGRRRLTRDVNLEGLVRAAVFLPTVPGPGSRGTGSRGTASLGGSR